MVLAPLAEAAPAAGVTVRIDPVNLTLAVGSTRQFSVLVGGTTNTAVTWSINGINGGNTTVGTISSTGFYSAPAVPPPGYTVTVKATSVADPTAFAAGTITVRNQTPSVTSVAPSPLPLGPFNITVNGSRFASGAQVLLNNAPLSTNFVSSTQLTASGNAAVSSRRNRHAEYRRDMESQRHDRRRPGCGVDYTGRTLHRARRRAHGECGDGFRREPGRQHHAGHGQRNHSRPARHHLRP